MSAADAGSIHLGNRTGRDLSAARRERRPHDGHGMGSSDGAADVTHGSGRRGGANPAFQFIVGHLGSAAAAVHPTESGGGKAKKEGFFRQVAGCVQIDGIGRPLMVSARISTRFLMASAWAVTAARRNWQPFRPRPRFPRLTSEQKGDIYMARKMYREAIGAYTSAKPMSALLWDKIGVSWQQLGERSRRKRVMSERLGWIKNMRKRSTTSAPSTTRKKIPQCDRGVHEGTSHSAAVGIRVEPIWEPPILRVNVSRR